MKTTVLLKQVRIVILVSGLIYMVGYAVGYYFK